ncbi:energy transducer TonB [Oryzomonas rubra]|uniref:Energy transducer TonB n=1 Tax=Oryzomonas rubra TaxID=2509454 RepID=A0A5A9XMI9_9BACT|nr:energy transducer TonB [Oryzomonas rubra]KAA0894060.1 energy transducer TonB [Oryzomonas rubra]
MPWAWPLSGNPGEDEVTAKGLGTCLIGSLLLHLGLGVLASRVPPGTPTAVRAVEVFAVEPPGSRLPRTGAPKPAHTGNALQRPGPETDRRQPRPPVVRSALIPSDRSAVAQAPLAAAPPVPPLPGSAPARVVSAGMPPGPLPARPPGERPGGAPTGPTGQEPAPGRVMALGDAGAPRFIHREAPLYPLIARRLGKEGRVVVRLSLDAQGRLQGIDTVEANGFGFAEAASAAIRKSSFAPAVKNGRGVSSQVLVPVRFVLHEGE